MFILKKSQLGEVELRFLAYAANRNISLMFKNIILMSCAG